MSRNKELAELTAKKEELMKKDAILIKRIRSINQQIDEITFQKLEEDLIQAENNALCDDLNVLWQNVS